MEKFGQIIMLYQCHSQCHKNIISLINETNTYRIIGNLHGILEWLERQFIKTTCLQRYLRQSDKQSLCEHLGQVYLNLTNRLMCETHVFE